MDFHIFIGLSRKAVLSILKRTRQQFSLRKEVSTCVRVFHFTDGEGSVCAKLHTGNGAAERTAENEHISSVQQLCSSQ